MGWFFKKNETKETDETKETKNENTEKDNEYVSDFDRRYKVDEKDPSKYKYHETEKDYEKEYAEKKNAEKKSDSGDSGDDGNADDDEMDTTPEHKRNSREIDDEDER